MSVPTLGLLGKVEPALMGSHFPSIRDSFLWVHANFPTSLFRTWGKWRIRMDLFGDCEFGLLSLNGWWGLDTTAEARRFARLLEERDGLWKIGTMRIIWSLRKLSKYVGGRYSSCISLCDL